MDGNCACGALSGVATEFGGWAGGTACVLAETRKPTVGCVGVPCCSSWGAPEAREVIAVGGVSSTWQRVPAYLK